MDKIIDRIRKLLALSESSNEHEAANAAARAAELMAEHQLDMAQIRVGTQEKNPDPIEQIAIGGDGSEKTWQRRVMNGLAEALGFHFWINRRQSKGNYTLVGRRDAISAGNYLAQYLWSEIDRLADRRWDETGRFSGQHGKTWKNSFRHGASITIYTRLVTEAAKRKSMQDSIQSQAMILIKKDAIEVAQHFKKLTENFTNKGMNPVKLNSGFEEGKQAGEKINLGGNKELGKGQYRLK